MKNSKEIIEILAEHNGDPLKVLHALGGYYECPVSSDGKRLGPLVGYAGKYDAGDGTKKQFVGDVYANFAIAEQYPVVMYEFATSMAKKITRAEIEVDRICGPQMGGIAIAQMTALIAGKRFAYIEKKITQLATEALREQSELLLQRHSIMPGERVFIMEDVLNNFSTTAQTIQVIHDAGGIVVGIGGLLNRSLTIESSYKHGEQSIPVIALVQKAIFEWKQGDANVVTDMAHANVVLKPKNEWARLMEAMEKAAIPAL